MIKREIDIELSPAELAEAFCNMHSSAQVAVLTEISRRADAEWGTGKAAMQWSTIGMEIAEEGDKAEPAKTFLNDVTAAIAHYAANPPPRVQWAAAPDPRTRHLAPPGGDADCDYTSSPPGHANYDCRPAPPINSRPERVEPEHSPSGWPGSDQ